MRVLSLRANKGRLTALSVYGRHSYEPVYAQRTTYGPRGASMRAIVESYETGRCGRCNEVRDDSVHFFEPWKD